MGARTDAARAEVLARRSELADEVVRLEAAGRAAVDIPAKVRQAPAQTVGLIGATLFVLLGGPKRAYRRARRAVFGPDANLPTSMLPKEIEKTLRSMGSDGDRVRGTLEREFANYIVQRSDLRREGDTGQLATVVAGNILKPMSSRLGRQLAESLFAPDDAGYNRQLDAVRNRAAEGAGSAGSGMAAAASATMNRVRGAFDALRSRVSSPAGDDGTAHSAGETPRSAGETARSVAETARSRAGEAAAVTVSAARSAAEAAKVRATGVAGTASQVARSAADATLEATRSAAHATRSAADAARAAADAARSAGDISAEDGPTTDSHAGSGGTGPATSASAGARDAGVAQSGSAEPGRSGTGAGERPRTPPG